MSPFLYQAGAVAAFTVDVLVYPLDTIKTRYQNQASLGAIAGRGAVPKGLYQGIGSVVIATLPAGERSKECPCEVSETEALSIQTHSRRLLRMLRVDEVITQTRHPFGGTRRLSPRGLLGWGRNGFVHCTHACRGG